MSSNSLHIDANRHRVFAVLSDGWTYSNWVVGTSHVRAVEAEWPDAGSRLFHCSGAWPVAARDETVVEECEVDRRLVLTARARPMGEVRIDLELSDEDGGCLVTMHENPTAGPGKWLFNPVADAFLHRRNTESLARLAALAEARTTPAD